MKRTYLIILTTLAMTFLMTTFVYAVVPHLIRFQGKVTDKSGAPLTGSYNITFRVYNAEAGGTLKWSETQTAVPVNNGIFTVLLGNVTPLDLPFDESYWLSMEVNNDGEMAPRQQLSSVGYAIHAETAERFIESSVIPSGAIILWTGTNCPAGYTRVAELDGRFIVGGATYNPAAGGSNTHTHTVPSHTHSFSGRAAGDNETKTEAGGGGGTTYAADSHGHSYSGNTGFWSGATDAGDSRPPFATILFCKKN